MTKEYNSKEFEKPKKTSIFLIIVKMFVKSLSLLIYIAIFLGLIYLIKFFIQKIF